MNHGWEHSTIELTNLVDVPGANEDRLWIEPEFRRSFKGNVCRVGALCCIPKKGSYVDIGIDFGEGSVLGYHKAVPRMNKNQLMKKLMQEESIDKTKIKIWEWCVNEKDTQGNFIPTLFGSPDDCSFCT